MIGFPVSAVTYDVLFATIDHELEYVRSAIMADNVEIKPALSHEGKVQVRDNHAFLVIERLRDVFP